MAQAKKAHLSAQPGEAIDALPTSGKGPTKTTAVLTLLHRDKGAIHPKPASAFHPLQILIARGTFVLGR